MEKDGERAELDQGGVLRGEGVEGVGEV